MKSAEVDLVWERDLYSRGHHLNHYPFDCVVSFVFRQYPRDKARADVGIVEVGCGAGNNLWFAAKEGFRVAGIDGSQSAIAYARQRLERDKLEGDLRVGSFTQLPWDGDSFDLAIDRCSLVCVGYELQKQAVAEVHRVLKVGGYFLCNGYSDRHSSAVAGVRAADGRTTEISDGTLVGAGAIFQLASPGGGPL
jgi:ubiquinone/menaquinone biosynthesis C-methylase UbiE